MSAAGCGKAMIASASSRVAKPLGSAFPDRAGGITAVTGLALILNMRPTPCRWTDLGRQRPPAEPRRRGSGM